MPRIPYNDKLAEDTYQSNSVIDKIDNLTNDDLPDNITSEIMDNKDYRLEGSKDPIEKGARYQMKKRAGNA